MKERALLASVKAQELVKKATEAKDAASNATGTPEAQDLKEKAIEATTSAEEAIKEATKLRDDAKPDQVSSASEVDNNSQGEGPGGRGMRGVRGVRGVRGTQGGRVGRSQRGGLGGCRPRRGRGGHRGRGGRGRGDYGDRDYWVVFFLEWRVCYRIQGCFSLCQPPWV